ncbi:lipase [Bacterioplanes sanyensis]|uniref:Lipase n=1 Tax=Bacterioplanes sanyensis TaxID=1249553 RepID=A0A222FGX4_9GAMM|nr:triacylglycerol lipase [Bacterioplanes sanyensis]ASP38305.1 lipase [Bacterioplanes sanyensis]
MKLLSVVVMLAAVLASSWSYAMSKSPDNSGYTATRYPIVLTHGLYGFDQLLGIDYWYKVPETLRADGAEVFVTSVSNSNAPEVRGEQLIPQLEKLRVISGADKFNLIGHSHGGPTVRYVASVRPDLVASVTTIAGVNKGTPVAEALNDWSEGSDAFAGLIATLGNTLAKVIDLLSGGGHPQDIMASLQSMTFAETEAFNQLHPGGIPATECGEGDYEYNGVRYYSWSGAKPVTNVLDPLDLLTGTTRLFFPAGEKNDGLVGSCGSRLGMVIRDDFRMNHLDEVNMTLGLHDLTETDPLTVFRTHANRLQQAGL